MQISILEVTNVTGILALSCTVEEYIGPIDGLNRKIKGDVEHHIYKHKSTDICCYDVVPARKGKHKIVVNLLKMNVGAMLQSNISENSSFGHGLLNCNIHCDCKPAKSSIWLYKKQQQ